MLLLSRGLGGGLGGGDWSGYGLGLGDGVGIADGLDQDDAGLVVAQAQLVVGHEIDDRIAQRARRNGVTIRPGTNPRLLSRLMMGPLASSSRRPMTRPLLPRRRSDRGPSESCVGGGVSVVPAEVDVLWGEAAVAMVSSRSSVPVPI